MHQANPRFPFLPASFPETNEAFSVADGDASVASLYFRPPDLTVGGANLVSVSPPLPPILCETPTVHNSTQAQVQITVLGTKTPSPTPTAAKIGRPLVPTAPSPPDLTVVGPNLLSVSPPLPPVLCATPTDHNSTKAQVKLAVVGTTVPSAPTPTAAKIGPPLVPTAPSILGERVVRDKFKKHECIIADTDSVTEKVLDTPPSPPLEKPCATPGDHLVYREGPYTKELDGRYSHINGVECIACSREVVGTRNTGLDKLGLTVLPTKSNPVWVCTTCQRMLLCNACFVKKRDAFNTENPGKIKRVCRRPASRGS
jgi:hypothetical protein